VRVGMEARDMHASFLSGCRRNCTSSYGLGSLRRATRDVRSRSNIRIWFRTFDITTWLSPDNDQAIRTSSSRFPIPRKMARLLQPTHRILRG